MFTVTIRIRTVSGALTFTLLLANKWTWHVHDNHVVLCRFNKSGWPHQNDDHSNNKGILAENVQRVGEQGEVSGTLEKIKVEAHFVLPWLVRKQL